MHIALNGWFWDQIHVGSGQYVHGLIKYLTKLAPDLKISLIVPPHISVTEALPPNVEVINTRGFSGKLGKIWFEQRTFPKMVASCGADIAHVPYWGPPLSSPAKLVTSILDVAPLLIPDYQRGLSSRLYTSLVSAASGDMAHTITLSEAAKDDIVEQLHIPREDITVTYLGVDPVYHPQLGAEKDEAVRQKYKLPDKFILHTGGFDIRKQVNLLLLAFTYVLEAQGTEVPLVLAGKQPKWGTSVFPDLPKYIEKLGIQEDVIWMGYFDEADKPSLYRLADVFVSPSMYEGFGLPVLEAMASGTPVVAYEMPVYQEIVGDGAFLVQNARNMAGAIIALLEQEPLRDSMINQGLAQATRYSWRKTAQQTLQVYEEVMKK